MSRIAVVPSGLLQRMGFCRIILLSREVVIKIGICQRIFISIRGAALPLEPFGDVGLLGLIASHQLKIGVIDTASGGTLMIDCTEPFLLQ